jgi:hypothetical protein
MFSLATQQLSQSQVLASHRSRFGGTELVFVSISGLAHNTGAAIFSEPHEFRWLALGSVVSIGASIAMFLWFMHIENISFGSWNFWQKAHRYDAVALASVEEVDQGLTGVAESS